MSAILIAIIVVLLIFLIRRWNQINDYWKDRRVPHVRPYPLVGNMLQNVIKRKTLGEIVADVGKQFPKEPIIGFYNFTKPAMIMNDVKYAEIVLVKEFSSFMDRGVERKSADMRPLDKHLFTLSGTEWKAVRSKMSPVFTTGKLKGMLPLMERVFQKISSNIDSSPELQLVQFEELYSVCVRASCVFGKDITDIDLSSEFVQKVHSLTTLNFTRFIGMTMALTFPKLATKLNFSVFGAQNEEYFVDILLRTFKERSQSKTPKNDFVQTLLELKNHGKVEVQSWSQEDDFLKTDERQLEAVEINDDILMSQSFIFLLAGLDTLLSTMTLCLLELCRNKKALERLRDEVDTTIGKHKEFSYQALKEMEYLDLCIKETMRIYPPVDFLIRSCTKNYTFDNGVTIHRGTPAILPIYKYHMDPQYFDEPEAFRPERFESDFVPFTYLPFGDGPRICIGMRFAMLELKMFLSKMIYTYDLSLDSRTQIPVQFDKWWFLRRVSSPVYMKYTKRSH